MFGSTRFMAPEELELGATLDERTTVFTLGRTALVFLSAGTLRPEAFRGSRAFYDVAARACCEEPSSRFASVVAFFAGWRKARRE